jgi:hypothetical protein
MDRSIAQQIYERCGLIRFSKRKMDMKVTIHPADYNEYHNRVDKIDNAAREITVLLSREFDDLKEPNFYII